MKGRDKVREKESAKMSIAPHSRKRVCYYYDSEFPSVICTLLVVLRMSTIDFVKNLNYVGKSLLKRSDVVYY